MKNVLRLEELSMFGLSIFLFSRLEIDWWWYPLLILTPDVSMLGYLVNPKVGAWTYNLVHHKAVGIGLYIVGILLADPLLQFIGILLFGHSSMDRMLGYGLKHTDSFQHTHLGMIGKA